MEWTVEIEAHLPGYADEDDLLVALLDTLAANPAAFGAAVGGSRGGYVTGIFQVEALSKQSAASSGLEIWVAALEAAAGSTGQLTRLTVSDEEWPLAEGGAETSDSVLGSRCECGRLTTEEEDGP